MKTQQQIEEKINSMILDLEKYEENCGSGNGVDRRFYLRCINQSGICG